MSRKKLQQLFDHFMSLKSTSPTTGPKKPVPSHKDSQPDVSAQLLYHKNHQITNAVNTNKDKKYFWKLN